MTTPLQAHQDLVARKRREAIERGGTEAMQAAAEEIKTADGLYPLLAGLNRFQSAFDEWNEGGERDIEHALHAFKIDITELPIFGGAEPALTSNGGVWSWDEDSLLVGVGSFHNWYIESREEA